MIRVRAFEAEDREFVMGLAERLVIGMPAWRDPERWLKAVEGWIEVSLAAHGGQSMVFVAEDERGKRLGFASVSHDRHFTGDPQAYIGELATSEAAEGAGVGKALVDACEGWAREQGYRFITLATGAANARALGFYRHLGYQDEDVKLVKVLEGES